MADMPADDITSDSAIAAPPHDAGDDSFADELAGNTYAADAQRRANPLYGIAQSQLLGLAEGGKADLVRNIGTVAALVREIAAQVDQVGIEPFAGYARNTASLVDELHGAIRDKSVEDLIGDGRALVRQNPEIAITMAAIIGFIGVRLFRVRR